MEGSASVDTQEIQPVGQIEPVLKKEPDSTPVKINFNRSRVLPSPDKSLEEKIDAVQAIEADESDEKWAKKWQAEKESVWDDIVPKATIKTVVTDAKQSL